MHRATVGGDECPIDEWAANPEALRRITDEGLTGPQALHGRFMGRIGEFLTSRGRRPMGWAETGTELPPEYTVAVWRDQAHGLAAARRGHDVVMAHHRSTYLDYAQSEDPGEPFAQPGPVVGLRSVHAYRPVPEEWEAAAARRVLGVHGQLCTEYAKTPENLEYLSFPRLCALADRAWPDSTARMRFHQARLDAMGVGYRPL